MTAQAGLGFSGLVAIQIPDGGAAGTALTKLSGEDYDYDWLPGGGGGADGVVISGTVSGQNLLLARSLGLPDVVVDLSSAIVGSAETIQGTMPAGVVPISALQVVVADPVTGTLRVADSSIAADANAVVGVAINAAPIIGAPVSFVNQGELQDAGFAFNTAINPTLFLNGNGVISQTPPTAPGSVFNLQIGFVTATDTMVVDISEPIFFSHLRKT